MIDPRLKEAADYIGSVEDPVLRDQAAKQLKLLLAGAVQSNGNAAPPIRTLRDYLAADIPIPPVLVTPSIIVRGETTATIGRAGKGKTTVNLHRLMRWAGGLPMFDELPDVLAPSQPLRCLIVENEGNAGMFQQKMATMLAAEGFIPEAARNEVLDNLMVWGDGGWSGMKLDDPEKYNLLRRGVEAHRPDIIFIEPFRSLWKGAEKDDQAMAEIIDKFAEIATTYDAGIIVAHHERKTGTSEDGEKMSAARGSTVLEGYVQLMENFEIAKGNEQRELSWSKSRYLPPPPPMRLVWDPERLAYRYVAPVRGAQEVLKFMADADVPVTARQIAESLDELKSGKPSSRLRGLLTSLTEDGRIKKGYNHILPGTGSTGEAYTLVSQGNDDERMDF